jgi:hypothetical protein
MSDDTTSEGKSTQENTVIDPLSMRDSKTTGLKRIKAKTDEVSVEALNDGSNETETVHLKVIKEKKTQLKNILSASQTIRLRPSTDGKPNLASQAATTDAPAVPAQDGGKATLKIKAPTVENASTESIEKGGDNSGKSTLKIKSPLAHGGDSGKATLKVMSPAESSGKATLKVKSPGAGQTQESPAPGGAKTLKLKGAPQASGNAEAQPQAPAAGTAAQPAASAKAPMQLDDDQGGQAKIIDVLVSAAGFVVVGVSIGFLATSFMQLFSG